ncbi:hypothetical protein [Flavobacterium tyrosinilyticum]|uniref:hypothetical protein n=1 Tax=Flavobacterium tyrosinilyticum TaxID=1658740 RepID=UPI00202ED515|nr:hypothetical protein [Flavobacterium tyrosinilyticum]MCM0666261.1 hypothetical protein [Flavobacterium tyrosinilyticum]
MTIQEYLDKIEALQNEKNKIVFSDNADLDLYIQKIKNETRELSFTLTEIFQKSNSKMTIINENILEMFSNHLGLLFLEEQESGNVCFANNNDVRPEYKQSFKLIDGLDYVYAFSHSTAFKESQKIIITSETDLFWKLAKIGSNLRERTLNK